MSLGEPRRGVDFETVYAAEVEEIRRRWETVYGRGHGREIVSDRPSTANNLVGLAFSGGGVRSATFNLGVAQALHRRGVFDHVDYMSTVSGGGYLGSSISVAMRLLPGEGEKAVPGKGEFPFAPSAAQVETEGEWAESPFVSWVRNSCNFMARGGFLDAARILGVQLRGLLSNLLVLLPILLALSVSLVWFHGERLAEWEAADQRLAAAERYAAEAEEAAALAAEVAAGGDAEARVRMEAAKQGADDAAKLVEEAAKETPSLVSIFPVSVWTAGIFLMLVLIFPVFIRVYKIYRHRDALEIGEESTATSRGQVEKAFAVVLVAIGLVAAFEALPLMIRWFHRVGDSDLRGLVAGILLVVAFVALAVAGFVLARLGGTQQRLVLFLVGLLGLVIPLEIALHVAEDLVYPVVDIEAGAPRPVYLVSAYVPEPMSFAEPFAGMGLAQLVAGILLMIVGAAVCASLVGRFARPGLLRFILTQWAILIGAAGGYAALIGASWGLAELGAVFGVEGIRPDTLLLAGALAILGFCWLTIDVNLTGVLGLYRDRLSAAYLAGVRWEVDRAGKETGRQEIFVEPDVNLEELSGGLERAGTEGLPTFPSKAPYHIVNVALNLQGSSNPLLRDRINDFFMFSKRYYGGERTGYCDTRTLERVFPQMDLPTAMAISASSVGPNAGRLSNKPLVALMTLFNVRLGYWVPNPGRLAAWLQTLKERRRQEEGGDQPSEEAAAGEELRLQHRWRWRVPPQALLREMASQVDEKHRWVNLSDGGHVENLAVYELLKRRCKYIILGDVEADPEMSFGGLATLMRLAQLDLGVKIEPVLKELRLDDERLSRGHCAFARIRYPPLKASKEKTRGEDALGEESPEGEATEKATPDEDRSTGQTAGGEEPEEEEPEEEEGYLIHIKPTLTGDEDPVVAVSRALFPSFPHESTASIFLDEGQFAAYRELGYHSVESLFEEADAEAERQRAAAGRREASDPGERQDSGADREAGAGDPGQAEDASGRPEEAEAETTEGAATDQKKTVLAELQSWFGQLDERFTQKPRGIFICYRRNDTAGRASDIYRALAKRFGEDQVFFDVGGDIPEGEDFRQVIKERLAGCRILLVLIGPRWLYDCEHDRLSEEVEPFVMDEDDHPRSEIEEALGMKNVLVLPLLLDGAGMPQPEDLPGRTERIDGEGKVVLDKGGNPKTRPGIKDLSYQNAFVISHKGFKEGLDSLAEQLDRRLKED